MPRINFSAKFIFLYLLTEIFDYVHESLKYIGIFLTKKKNTTIIEQIVIIIPNNVNQISSYPSSISLLYVININKLIIKVV